MFVVFYRSYIYIYMCVNFYRQQMYTIISKNNNIIYLYIFGTYIGTYRVSYGWWYNREEDFVKKINRKCSMKFFHLRFRFEEWINLKIFQIIKLLSWLNTNKLKSIKNQ